MARMLQQDKGFLIVTNTPTLRPIKGLENNSGYDDPP
jgi:hypothetical protein